MQVVYICVALYKISTGTPASRGPSEIDGLLAVNITARNVLSSVLRDRNRSDNWKRDEINIAYETESLQA